MRIGFDAKRAFHNRTGLGNYSRDIIRLFTQNRSADEFYLFDPKGQADIHFDYNLFNTQTISAHRKTGLGKSLWRTYGLSREIKALHLDVYHGLSNELPIGIEQSGAKSILTVHDLIFDRHPEWYPFIDRKIYRAKAARALASATKVVAISQQTKADIIALYGTPESKIEVVYQGCMPVFLVPQTAAQIAEQLEPFGLPDAFVLYVGTIEPRKNLLRLVQALKDQNIPLVVVGGATDYYKKVQEAMRQSPLAKHFYKLENVSAKQLAALYQKARIFVYPSLYEGFGIPVIEALHSGTPVITGVGALKEAAGPGGICVDVSNVDALREAIRTTWQNDALLARLSEAGKHHAQRFTDAVVWQSWQKVYQTL